MKGFVSTMSDGVLAIRRTKEVSLNKLIITLQRKIKELVVLYEISQLIGSSFDCQEVFSNVLDIFQAHLGMNRGTITLRVVCILSLGQVRHFDPPRRRIFLPETAR